MAGVICVSSPLLSYWNCVRLAAVLLFGCGAVTAHPPAKNAGRVGQPSV